MKEIRLELKIKLNVSPQDLLDLDFKETEEGIYKKLVEEDEVTINISSRIVRFKTQESAVYLLDNDIAFIDIIERDIK